MTLFMHRGLLRTHSSRVDFLLAPCLILGQLIAVLPIQQINPAVADLTDHEISAQDKNHRECRPHISMLLLNISPQLRLQLFQQEAQTISDAVQLRRFGKRLYFRLPPLPQAVRHIAAGLFAVA